MDKFVSSSPWSRLQVSANPYPRDIAQHCIVSIENFGALLLSLMVDSYHQICEALGYEREYVDATKDELLPTIFTLSTPQGIDASNPSTYDGEMSLSEGNWDVGSACNTLTVPDAWSGEASSDFDKTANVDQSTWDKYEDNPGVKVHGWLGRYSALSGASLDGMWLTG